MELNKIILGDALEELKKMPDNSIDSIVTDPPAGISFMGKEWDTFDKDMFGKKGEEGDNDLKIKKNFEILPRYGNADLRGFQDFICAVFTEAIRVLKPGAHALVWAIPRTSHHTAMGLERAGFEIRDCVYHIFGSGFPKSLNIGKAVDKLQGNKREIIGNKKGVGNNNFCGDKNGLKENFIETKGTSNWEGWGTALKPAVECWWLIRKPISEKTVAENVLKWGTGGINIDGSRVGTEGGETHKGGFQKQYVGERVDYENHGVETDLTIKGRFPAHLTHDGSEEVLAGFPNIKSQGKRFNKQDKYPNRKKPVVDFGGGFHTDYNDNGSAARFFYCAKPSRAERDMGCDELPEKLAAGLPLRAEGGNRGGEAEDGSSTDRIVKARNFHPTVKALALMTYLIKLITPPNGVVLDMFAGSGSTLIAAKKLGHPFIGIEKEADYIKIAKARIKAVPEGML